MARETDFKCNDLLTKDEAISRDVIGRIRAGDSSAWTDASRHYRGSMLFKARGSLIVKDDAEDIVQDVWLALAAKISTEPGDVRRLRPYLMKTVAFKCCNANRKILRQNTWTASDELAAVVSETAGPMENVLHDQSVELVATLINQLRTQRDRDVLTQHILHGKPRDNVRRRHGLSREAFSKVLSRARRRLKSEHAALESTGAR